MRSDAAMKLLSLVCSLVSTLVGFGWSNPSLGNVVPDSTLPQPSRVTQSGHRRVITQGTRRGSNLFHSFRDFSVAAGETASFQNLDSSVANVFARVTGQNISRINGIIEALQANQQISSANLFLINPNGIIFGPNAILRLGGSFLATTTNSVNFADGTRFSAIAPQSSPLLTVSIPVGLQFNGQAGRIVNRSVAPLRDANGNPIIDPFTTNPLTGLNGSTNRTIALVGGDVVFVEGGSIRSYGGRIEIGSVSTGQVTLTPAADGWDLSYADVKAFSDVYLGQSVLDSGSPLSSDIAAGPIQLQGRQVRLANGALIFPVTSTQAGRAVEITASDTVLVEGIITTASQGRGQAGDVNVSVRQLVIRNGGRIGSISYQDGRSGSITIDASEAVTLGELLPDFPGLDVKDRLSLLYVQSIRDGTMGDLNITTPRLTVGDGVWQLMMSRNVRCLIKMAYRSLAGYLWARPKIHLVMAAR
jgi:filamentous hemagglutinin family protein